MKLSFYRSVVPNFGDELNATMWDDVLPAGFLDEDESELFVGIGSIIWNKWPKAPMKHIMGSGYGGYGGPAPDIRDGTWNPVFVRGPRTAKILGLEPEKAICDSAILLRQIKRLPERDRNQVGFMPHFQSLQWGRWRQASEMAGVMFIDPTSPVDMIFDQLSRCKLIITEAMHGAIVSDALRIPWVAVKPTYAEHHMKWLDWADSLNIDLRLHPFAASSMLEAFIGATQRAQKPGPRSFKLNDSKWMAGANKLLTYRAAKRLAALAKTEPQLSDDRIIDSVSSRALETVNAFVAARRT